MRNHISYAALAVALVAAASTAHAQTETEITRETIQTVRSAPPPAHPPRKVVSRQPARSWERNRAANDVTTTRTIVRERVIPAPTVVTPPVTEVVEAPAVRAAPYRAPLYNVGVEEPVVAPPPFYNEAIGPALAPPPLYDGSVPAVGPVIGGIAPVPSYRYVYEPGRILVIDPYTNIAVQAIPR